LLYGIFYYLKLPFYRNEMIILLTLLSSIALLLWLFMLWAQFWPRVECIDLNLEVIESEIRNAALAIAGIVQFASSNPDPTLLTAYIGFMLTFFVLGALAGGHYLLYGYLASWRMVL